MSSTEAELIISYLFTIEKMRNENSETSTTYRSSCTVIWCSLKTARRYSKIITTRHQCQCKAKPTKIHSTLTFVTDTLIYYSLSLLNQFRLKK